MGVRGVIGHIFDFRDLRLILAALKEKRDMREQCRNHTSATDADRAALDDEITHLDSVVARIRAMGGGSTLDR